MIKGRDQATGCGHCNMFHLQQNFVVADLDIIWLLQTFLMVPAESVSCCCRVYL